MDYLFTSLMLWGKEHRYRWFSLGMAPLAGLEDYAPGSLWSAAGRLVYRYGEHFYNFEGLRRYKNKFHSGLDAALSGVSDGMAVAAGPCRRDCARRSRARQVTRAMRIQTAA